MVVCAKGDGGAVIVATDAFFARTFSLIVEAPSLPDCAIEVTGDAVEDLLSKDLPSTIAVSTTIGAGRATIFTLTSLSGTGGGGSDGRPLAVFVDVVERIEVDDLTFRGTFLGSGAGLPSVAAGVALVIFLVREGPACEAVETAEAFESRLGRVLEGVGVGEDGDFLLVTECSEAPDCFLDLGIVNRDVDAESSERALLKLVSVLFVADEMDLERFDPPLVTLSPLLDGVDDMRGLVTVTTEGAFRDLIDCAEEDGPAREGAEMLGANEGLGEPVRLLMVLRGVADLALLVALFVIVDADAADAAEAVEAAEAVDATDRSELAEEVSRLRTEGVVGLRTLLRKVVGRTELARLEVSSSVTWLRTLNVEVCLWAGEPFGTDVGVLLNRSSTGTSISWLISFSAHPSRSLKPDS